MKKLLRYLKQFTLLVRALVRLLEAVAAFS